MPAFHNRLITTGEATSDGAGVHLTRFVGVSDIPYADPFLLLDEFRSDDPEAYINGFPSHPHRGFETITYIINGRMRHRDSKGHEGLLESGWVQWMSAARGIIHSEMPEMEHGLLWGYQLWVNLPSSLKMVEPQYEDISVGRIPICNIGNAGWIKVISGEVLGKVGPVKGRTPIQYLHVQLDAESVFSADLITGRSVLISMIEGSLYDRQRKEDGIYAGMAAHFHLERKDGGGDDISEFVSGKSGAQFLLFSGEPIGEAVARGGPFVMNTREEILNAFHDYESGNF